MEMNQFIPLCYYILSAIGLLISLLFNIIQKIKNRKNAKNSEEKEQATEDLKTQIKTFIKTAEIAYKDVNAILKAKGESAGPLKFESVITKAQNYAIEKGYTFDADYWTKYINEEVELAKVVNAQ